MSPSVQVTKHLHVHDFTRHSQQPDQEAFVAISTIIVCIIILFVITGSLITVGAAPPGPLADMNNHQVGYSHPLSLWVSSEYPPSSTVGSHYQSITVGTKAETPFASLVSNFPDNNKFLLN